MGPESIDAPATRQEPTTIRVKHKDAPWLKDAAPGDPVHLHMKGHIHSNRGGDKYGDGEAEVDVHSVKNGGDAMPAKKKNAANMPVDELKEVIKSQQPKGE